MSARNCGSRKLTLSARLIAVKRRRTTRRKLRDQMPQTNALIKAECEKSKKVKFVDVWAAMFDAKGKPKNEFFIADKLHINQKGYDIWRDILAKYLK